MKKAKNPSRLKLLLGKEKLAQLSKAQTRVIAGGGYTSADETKVSCWYSCGIC